MINNVTIVGRTTKDVELRTTGDGTSVANFTIAANRPFKNKQGEQEADFINCVAWRKNAEVAAKYTKKGSMIGITGRIQTRKYENNEGRTVFVTEVVAESVQLLEPKKQNNQSNNDISQQQQQNDSFESKNDEINISDDDIPF